MPLAVKTLMRKEVVLDNLSADEQLKRQGRKHVQTKAKACHIDERVIGREVVEYVTLCFVGEYKVAGHCQRATRHKRNHRRNVRNLCETIKCWSS